MFNPFNFSIVTLSVERHKFKLTLLLIMQTAIQHILLVLWSVYEKLANSSLRIGHLTVRGHPLSNTPRFAYKILAFSFSLSF